MAGGALTGSVRVVRPGRCPVSAPCPEANVAVCGSVVAAAWGLVELAVCVLMVMGKGPRVRAVSVHSHWMAKHTSWKAGLGGYQKGGLVERKGKWHHRVSAVMATMWALSTS